MREPCRSILIRRGSVFGLESESKGKEDSRCEQPADAFHGSSPWCGARSHHKDTKYTKQAEREAVFSSIGRVLRRDGIRAGGARRENGVVI